MLANVFLITSIAQKQPPQFKTSIPSTDDLLHVASELGASWKMLGRALEIPKHVLENIEADNPKQSERCFYVLERWREAFGKEATYERLERALQHPMVGKKNLAVKFCGVCPGAYQGKE